MSVKHVLRPDQEQAVWRILAEPTHAAAIASAMGRGKTTLGAEVLIRGGFKRALLVGVRDTYHQWSDRIEAQSDGAIHLRRIDSTKAGRQAFEDFLAGHEGAFFCGSQFLVTQDLDHIPETHADGSPKMMVDKKTGLPTDKQETKRVYKRRYANMKPVDLLLVDEVHVFANRTSAGRRVLGSIKTDWRIAMSGTIFANRFESAWSITRWLWPTLVTGRFNDWKTEWCTTETVYVKGGKPVGNVTGEKHPGVYVSTLPLFIRAEAEEEPPAPKIVTVTLTPAQREIYDTLEQDLIVWLDSHAGLAPLVAELPITLRSRLRTATLGELSLDADGEIQFAMDCASSKLTALRGVVDAWGDQSVVIGTDSKKFAKVTVARMKAAGYGAVEWSGDVSSKERDRIKERFISRDPEYRYLVGVIPAMSTGIDGLQGAASKMVVLSQSENEMVNAQFIARLFRPGRTLEFGDFELVNILAENTLDTGTFGRLLATRLSTNASMRTHKLAA